MTAPDLTPLLADRETLARALYRLHAWSGCAGSDWDRVPELVRVEFRDQVDALITSGILQTPGQYVAGLADDETLLLRCARSLNMCAGADEADDFAVMLRALATALTERTDQ